MSTARPTISYVSALCLYGTIGWVLHYVSLPAEVVVLVRGIVGTLFICIVLALLRRPLDRQGVRANLKWLVFSGLSLGLNWVLLFSSYHYTTLAIASLLNYMAPVGIILVAPLLLGEQRSLRKLACAAVAVVGMILVSGVLEGGAEGGSTMGTLLALGAALGFMGMVICNKKMGEVAVFEKAAIQLASGAMAALPFVVVMDWGMPLHPDALSVALVLVLGVVHTGFAYCLYFGALGKLSAQTIAVLGYIEPAVAVLVSYFALHEPLSALGWAGAVLILGAAAASEVIG